MKVEMMGYIANVAMKVGVSSDLTKEVKLDVHGDMASLQELMKQPLKITLEPMQATFGQDVPERKGARKVKAKGDGDKR